MSKIKENMLIFIIGALGYMLLEILWRNYTHWTMGIVGGLCFILLYHISNDLPFAPWQKYLLGAFSITFVELISGCIINLWLGLNVWSYASCPYNLLGQVCLSYSLIWLLLCLPVFKISAYMHKILHRRQSILSQTSQIQKQN